MLQIRSRSNVASTMCRRSRQNRAAQSGRRRVTPHTQPQHQGALNTINRNSMSVQPRSQMHKQERKISTLLLSYSWAPPCRRPGARRSGRPPAVQAAGSRRRLRHTTRQRRVASGPPSAARSGRRSTGQTLSSSPAWTSTATCTPCGWVSLIQGIGAAPRVSFANARHGHQRLKFQGLALLHLVLLRHSCPAAPYVSRRACSAAAAADAVCLRSRCRLPDGLEHQTDTRLD